MKKPKTKTRNPVIFLLTEAGRSPAWIANASGASYRSVENWMSKPISRYYRPVLERLAKREETRLAAQIIREAKP